MLQSASVLIIIEILECRFVRESMSHTFAALDSSLTLYEIELSSKEDRRRMIILTQ